MISLSAGTATILLKVNHEPGIISEGRIMIRDHKIGVIVPAYDEELLILDTLKGIPDYVDRIFVVNDASRDNTLTLVETQQKQDSRIEIIDHQLNRGIGQSLIDGYLASLASDVDITAVMAGDNQMHPDDLIRFMDTIIDGGYDYVKGNRLLHENIDIMPRYRFFGNSILTILTKFATGFYALMDPQSGYTAIKNSVLARIPIKKMTQGYGYNADILCMLNIQRFRVCDVEVKPVYGREQSKIKLRNYIPKTSWLLVKLFFRRLWRRYVILDFHPLILFYLFAFINFTCIFTPLLVRFLYLLATEGQTPKTTMIIMSFSFLMAFQSMLFAIWMDMDYNR